MSTYGWSEQENKYEFVWFKADQKPILLFINFFRTLIFAEIKNKLKLFDNLLYQIS